MTWIKNLKLSGVVIGKFWQIRKPMNRDGNFPLIISERIIKILKGGFGLKKPNISKISLFDK